MNPTTQPDRVVTLLRSLPMFRGLSPDQHQRLVPLASVRDLDRGEVLWREGDAADQLTVIVTGQVKIVRHADAGDVILEIFGEGEPVGAIAVYNCIPYPATAIALDRTVLLCIPRRDYFELLDRNPEFTRAIMRELTKLVLALTRKVQESRGQRVDGRVAQLLGTLAERMGKDTPEGLLVPLTLTRQEIADLVGTTVESAIRVLSRWGREGIVVTRDDGFLIPSRERLTQIAEGREA